MLVGRYQCLHGWASENYIFLPLTKEDVNGAGAVVQEAELLRRSRVAALPSRHDVASCRTGYYLTQFECRQKKLQQDQITLRKYFLKGEANESNKS